jgi:hypothetical protein
MGLSQTGYTFMSGWGTTTTCSSNAYQQKITSEVDNLTLYACKTANISGAITLDSNRWATSDASSAATTATTTALVTSSSNKVYSKYAVGMFSNSGATTSVTKLYRNPAMTGYTFAGFYTGKAGSGTQVIDASGNYLSAASIQVTSKNGTATWYAHWTPNNYEITLDDSTNSGSGGSGKVYTTYNVNVYKDSARANAMTTSANGVTVPTRSGGYKFLGYYNSASGTTQYIDANGKITSGGLSTGKAVTNNTTKWYARFEGMTVSAPTKKLAYTGSAQSCANVTVSAPSSGATITYSNSANGTYGSSAPTITDAGTTTVYYKVNASGYTEYSGSYKCTVNRVTLSAASGTITYPTTTTTFTATCQSGGALSVASSDTSIATATISSGTVTVTWKAAGTANITVTCAASGDYAAATATYAVTTAKGACTVTLDETSGTITYPTTTKTVTASTNSNGTLSVSTANVTSVNRIPRAASNTWTSNGLTMTTAGDGIYHINGTTTAATSITIPLTAFNIPSSGNGGRFFAGNTFVVSS